MAAKYLCGFEGFLFLFSCCFMIVASVVRNDAGLWITVALFGLSLGFKKKEFER